MDLQKITQEAVKAASQANGTVNFNFNDIHNNQNVYLGADGKTDISENISKVSPLDETKLANLGKYVPLPERVEDIARQLQTVKCAQDFKQVVRQIYDMYVTQKEKEVILTKPFRETLMLFVADWHPSDNAIYRHCLNIYSER